MSIIVHNSYSLILTKDARDIHALATQSARHHCKWCLGDVAVRASDFRSKRPRVRLPAGPLSSHPDQLSLPFLRVGKSSTSLTGWG